MVGKKNEKEVKRFVLPGKKPTLFFMGLFR